MIVTNLDIHKLREMDATEASVTQINRCLKAAKEFLNVKFKHITEAKLITMPDNELWQAIICYTEGLEGFGIALGDWRFLDTDITVFSIFFMAGKGYMMEIHKGDFYDVLPLFPQTNGELVTAYRRGEGNATKGIYFKIPESENWFYVRDEGQEFSEKCKYSFSENDLQKMSVEKMETKQWFPCEEYARFLNENKSDIEPLLIHSDILSGIKR